MPWPNVISNILMLYTNSKSEHKMNDKIDSYVRPTAVDTMSHTMLDSNDQLFGIK